MHDARLRGSRRAVKAALLDQSVVAGVGNIYADEALFQARIAPTRVAARLSPGEVQSVHPDSKRSIGRPAGSR